MKYYPRWCPKLLDRSSTCTTHCTWWGGCKYLGIKWKGGKCIDSKKWWNEWVIFFLKHWKMKQWNQIQMSWGKNISRLIYERVVLSDERISKGFFLYVCSKKCGNLIGYIYKTILLYMPFIQTLLFVFKQDDSHRLEGDRVKLLFPGTNISPTVPRTFDKDDFPFSKVGYVSLQEGWRRSVLHWLVDILRPWINDVTKHRSLVVSGSSE